MLVKSMFFKIIKKFKDYKIEVARPVFIPLDKYYYGKFVCKNSERFYKTTISIPIYPELSEKEVQKILNVVIREL